MWVFAALKANTNVELRPRNGSQFDLIATITSLAFVHNWESRHVA